MAETKIEKLRFEEALAELETVVDRLESGEVALEQSISLYERGEALRKHCEARLKSAELRVEKIVGGADGPPETEPFEAG